MTSLIRIRRSAVALCAAFVLARGTAVPALADATAADVDLNGEGSIAVTLASNDGAHLTDGELSAYRVAALVLDDGNMAYEYTSAFEGCTVALDDAASASLAAELAAWVEAHGIAATATSAVSSAGEASFAGLPVGLYLVVQTGAPPASTRSTPSSSPSPSPRTARGSTTWTRARRSSPPPLRPTNPGATAPTVPTAPKPLTVPTIPAARPLPVPSRRVREDPPVLRARPAAVLRAVAARALRAAARAAARVPARLPSLLPSCPRPVSSSGRYRCSRRQGSSASSQAWSFLAPGGGGRGVSRRLVVPSPARSSARRSGIPFREGVA